MKLFLICVFRAVYQIRFISSCDKAAQAKNITGQDCDERR